MLGVGKDDGCWPTNFATGMSGADGSVDGGPSAFRGGTKTGDELLLSGDSACHEKKLFAAGCWTRNAKAGRLDSLVGHQRAIE